MAKQKNIPQPPKTITEANFYDTYIRNNELYYLLGITSLICLFVFRDFITLKKIYLFKDIGSDTINMFHPLLIHYSEYLKKEGVPGWTFSQGMGQNLFPLWMGDFFTNFIMLFDKGTLPKVIVFMEILKIFLCAFIFFKYLKEIKVSGFAAMIGALLYAFSGYVVLGGTWTIFSTEAVYVAILLLGVERWLSKSKWFLFLLGIALLGFLQPFYLFSYTLFLSGYIIVRYNDLHEFNWTSFFIFGLKTVGIAALGVAITSYQLLPDILQYTESPRVGGEAGLSARLKAQPMFALADDILRFTTTFRAFGSDMLGTGNDFKGWQNYLEAPLFYCGILSLVAFPQMFSSLNKKQKIFYGVLTFVFALPVLFPYFRYAFWVFAGDYFRTFSLVIVLLMLIYTVKAISFIEQQNSINKITLIVTTLFLLFLLYSPAAQFQTFIDKGMRGMAAFLVLTYAGLIYALSLNSNVKNTAKISLVIVCIFEMLIFANRSVNKRNAMSSRELTEKVGYNDYTIDAINYIKEKDKTFFRVQKDYFSGLAMHASINDAKAQGYFGTPSYHSFNQLNYIKFLGDLNIIDAKDENATRWAKGLVDRPLVFSLASGKYWLSKRPQNYLQQFGYDSIAKLGDVKVFKNRYALPFGFAYDQIDKLSDFKKLSNVQKDLYLLKGCVIDNEDATSFSAFKTFNLKDTTQLFSFDEYAKLVSVLRKDSLTITSFTENHIEGNMRLTSPKILFFSIPFDGGWSAKVNNADTKLYRVNAGLTGLMLNPGKNDVVLQFTPRLKNQGRLISMIALLILGLLLFLDFRKSRKTATKNSDLTAE